VEAYGTDGVVVPVTVRLSDRYSNPVLDGTAVTFHANGGQIVGSCTTTAGACEADWTSAQPRPQTTDDNPPLLANGRVTILATAIGEEFFTDTNRDGFWESGEPFDNLGEPYEDDNENGTFDSLEYYLDYNHDGKWDGPSGSFVGITCTGTDASSTCTTNTLALGASHLLIMSTAAANVTYVSSTGFTGNFGGFTITKGTAGSITFNVADLNNNPIAAGSTIKISADTAVGTVSASSASFTEGCATAVGGQQWTTFINAAAADGGGTITIEVTSPGTATQSIYTIPVNVTG